MDDETFRKAQAYGRDKMRYGAVKSALAFVTGGITFWINFVAKLWDWSGDIMDVIGLSRRRTASPAMV